MLSEAIYVTSVWGATRAHTTAAQAHRAQEDTACIDRLLQLGADTSLTNPVRTALPRSGRTSRACAISHYDDFNVTFGRPRQGANPAPWKQKAAPRWRTSTAADSLFA